MTLNLHSLIGLLWLSPWIALQGIPNTGPIRSLFILIGLIHLVWTIKRRDITPVWPKNKIDAWLLGLLTLWLVVQSTMFSISTTNALFEFADHFGKIILFVFVGITFVAYQKHSHTSWLLHGVFIGFFVHTISTISFQAWTYITSGHLSIGMSFLDNYGYVSPFVTGGLAFILADLVSRHLNNKRIINVPTWLLLVMFGLTIVAHGLLAAKAGLVMAVVLIVTSGIALIIKHKSSRFFSTGIVAIILLITIVGSNVFSNRWDGAINHANNAAHNADTVSAFKGTFSGDASFYQRFAWGKAGIEGILKHPFGYGYGSEGYGKYIAETYDIQGVVSSHSGWIDFTLDNGIPAIMLLLTLSAALTYRGWRAFMSGNTVGLILSLFVINYIVRCAIDGHLVGSRLTGFAFAAAILWAITVKNDAHPSN